MSSLAERRSRLNAASYAAFGEAATWTPAGGGAAASVSVRRREGDEQAPVGRGQVLMRINFLTVRRSEISEPAAGDLVAIGADTFKVVGEPELAGRGTQWRCQAVQVFA